MRALASRVASLSVLVLAAGMASFPKVSHAQQDGLPVHLRDRGPGLPTSMFGTYIQKRELLIYPFFEYYFDNDIEYKPAELGFGLEEDYQGRFRASEGILFLGYGLADWLAIEFEAAVIDASLEKDPNDPSATPDKIEESGVGDVEGQLRLRWVKEKDGRPELFSYFEAVSPQQRNKLLIGTPDWELKAGIGLIKGSPWGTLTVRAAGEYLVEDSTLDFGEYAVEYLKRLSPVWRLYLGVEGTQDEASLITEAQWHITDYAFLKLNNGVAITSKATDWAPEIGIMFTFPPRKESGD